MASSKKPYIVQKSRTGSNYFVVRVADGKIIEGGFFDRAYAEECRDELNADATFDPNSESDYA